MYTRAHPSDPMEMVIGNLQGADYSPAKTTKFIIHSNEEKGTKEYVQNIKDMYLYVEDMNAIVVDWGDMAGGFDSNTRDRAAEVGRHSGTFMNYLYAMGGNNAITHCVGFGMGSHVCGYAGKTVFSANNPKISRITGLEPLSDGYDYGKPDERLYILDADFVDVIHTCSGRMSFSEPIGHADFYPMSGECGQPGCGLEGLFVACSHDRAHELFIESITINLFRSTKCDSWNNFKDDVCAGNEEQYMGAHCDPLASGNYYLYTEDKPPFSMG
ncbi:hypothetical protein B566_EDAN005880 [Ephemera danica]|nr:hypothetical protein B566_EDAN005880 [Ephemera danica]